MFYLFGAVMPLVVRQFTAGNGGKVIHVLIMLLMTYLQKRTRVIEIKLLLKHLQLRRKLFLMFSYFNANIHYRLEEYFCLRRRLFK